jgi:hypothetical protein
MPEFLPPLSPRDEGWIDLRERLARAARNLHFVAISNDAANGPKLLIVSGDLADLALSIPMGPAPRTSAGMVDASTLFATQMLQGGADDDEGAPRR